MFGQVNLRVSSGSSAGDAVAQRKAKEVALQAEIAAIRAQQDSISKQQEDIEKQRAALSSQAATLNRELAVKRAELTNLPFQENINTQALAKIISDKISIPVKCVKNADTNKIIIQLSVGQYDENDLRQFIAAISANKAAIQRHPDSSQVIVISFPEQEFSRVFRGATLAKQQNFSVVERIDGILDGAPMMKC